MLAKRSALCDNAITMFTPFLHGSFRKSPCKRGGFCFIMHGGGNMSSELLQLMSFGISALMAVIALITLYKSQQKQNDDENTKSVSMELSINYMQKSIDEVSHKQDKLIDASNRSERRISIIEATLKDVVNRVNQLEGRHE